VFENQHTVSLLTVIRLTVAGADIYPGQHLAAGGDMYHVQPAMSPASYQGYVISKDAVNAAAAAAAPVAPVSSM